jgi:hypothetical protein
MDTIFGRWEIALADDVYITTRNGSYFLFYSACVLPYYEKSIDT